MTIENFRIRFAVLPALALFALLPGASAGTIFTLNQDKCTGGCGAATFGTITVTQVTPTQLSIVENLSTNERFAGTGAGDALEFNFDLPFVISNISAGFAVGPSPDSASGFGSFLQSVTCTACQGGNAGNPTGPLLFTLTNAAGLSVTDFIPNSGGFYFASDIVGSNGNTGNVAANSLVAQAIPPAVPEPVSSVLVGTALLGLGIIRFRRRNSVRVSAH